jgi:hypothetical protein
VLPWWHRGATNRCGDAAGGAAREGRRRGPWQCCHGTKMLLPWWHDGATSRFGDAAGAAAREGGRAAMARRCCYHGGTAVLPAGAAMLPVALQGEDAATMVA